MTGAGTNADHRPPGGTPFRPVWSGLPGSSAQQVGRPAAAAPPGGGFSPEPRRALLTGSRGRGGVSPQSCTASPSGGVCGGLVGSNTCSPLEQFAGSCSTGGSSGGAYPPFALRRPHSHSDGLQPVYGVTPPPGCWEASREAVRGSNRAPEVQNRTSVRLRGEHLFDVAREWRFSTLRKPEHLFGHRTPVRPEHLFDPGLDARLRPPACAPVRLCVCARVIKRP